MLQGCHDVHATLYLVYLVLDQVKCLRHLAYTFLVSYLQVQIESFSDSI